MNIIGGTHPNETARFTDPKTKTAIRRRRLEDGAEICEVFTRLAGWQLITPSTADGLCAGRHKLRHWFNQNAPDLMAER